MQKTTEPLASGGSPLLMMLRDTQTAVRWAMCFLGLAKAMCLKPAVCFDIDGTVLINMKNGRTKCQNYMKLLVDACAQAGISIFYVTARPDEPENRKYTEKQLRSCGLDLHHTLYMMPARAEYGNYKWHCRRNIESAGYTILLSVGDQFADLTKDKHVSEQLRDDCFYAGCIGDSRTFAIKLPSEFL